MNRVYVGTGNPNPDHQLPNEPYSSGILSLDATTGQFRGFFQPVITDSYRPGDNDIDIPASPMLFRRGNQTLLGIGSKNGSFFLLDADTMTAVGRRQLLPYRYDDPAQPVPGVDPGSGSSFENHSGVYGTAAVDYEHGNLFVGLGGWGASIDTNATPFMRALTWNNSLDDAWSTSDPGDGVRRYTVPRPPMYTSPGEEALSSPAIVNDVVLVTTNRPALYALDTATGACLWSAPGLPQPAQGNPVADIPVLGPAVYGDYIVIGCGTNVYIYERIDYIFHIPHIPVESGFQWPPIPPESGIFHGPSEMIGPGE